MESITIRPPRLEDAEPLEAMITDHFGEDGSYTVELGIDDPDLHVLVAETDAELVGVMALEVHDDRAGVEEEMYLIDSLDPVAPADRYGLLEMGYVREAYTGRGIGSRLIERLEEVGCERGVTVLVADSWFHGGPDSPEQLFVAHGYEVPHRHSIADETDGPCSKCAGECTCEAALAAKRLDPDAAAGG
ncbi:N-acetyltransferase [Halobacteriales archaeon QH_10_67_13]|nr:MAG: N-acetyltransferase [Halobacteriales archaeon QH_10_67_13]